MSHRRYAVVGAGHRVVQALLLLVRRQRRREEEELQVAVLHLGQVGRYCLSYPNVSADAFQNGVFFWPELAVRHLADRPESLFVPGAALSNPYVEAAKWCAVLAIAVWLTVAQVAAVYAELA